MMALSYACKLHMHLACICLLLFGVEVCLLKAAPISQEIECLEKATNSDNNIVITVDCTSTPSLAQLTMSDISEVHYLNIFYSCSRNDSTVVQNSKEDEDLESHEQRSYNLSVPIGATNCSFTICYVYSQLYYLYRTTRTCVTALPPIVTVDPVNADLTVGTTTTITCSTNGTSTTSWLPGSSANVLSISQKTSSNGSGVQSVVRLSFNTTGVKKVVCLSENGVEAVSATTSINVVDSLLPSKPYNLSYLALSPSFLSVSWQNPTSNTDGVIPVIGYSVVLRSLQNEILRKIQVNSSNDKAKYSIELHGIEKFVPYIIQVSTINKYGYSETISIYAFSEQGIPNKSPRNVTVRRINNTAIHVMWHLLTLQEARGFITSYTVYYQQTTDSSSWQGQRQQGIKHAVVVSGQEHVVTITNLDPLSDYSVEVSATTSAGETSLDLSTSIVATNSKLIHLCFNIKSCQHWKTNGTTVLNNGLPLITSYFKQTCGLIVPISTAQCTCSCHNHLTITARIFNRDVSALIHQLTSCVSRNSLIPRTIDGVKITSDTCENSRQHLCSTQAAQISSSPVAPSHTEFTSTTVVMVIVIVLLVLTAIVFSGISTLIIFLSRRKAIQPQEFADYIPKATTSNQLEHISPNIPPNTNHFTALTSCNSNTVEGTKLNHDPEQSDQIHRWKSHHSVILVSDI